jgi:hypothetical protein
LRKILIDTVVLDEILYHPKRQYLVREMMLNKYLLVTKQNYFPSISKSKILMRKEEEEICLHVDLQEQSVAIRHLHK